MYTPCHSLSPQAPYLIYVEVLDCENKHTSPLPAKILENTLRFTKSEENLSRYFHSELAPATHTPPNTYAVYHINDSDHECWSQEDDDILQVRWMYKFSYRLKIKLSSGHVIAL